MTHNHYKKIIAFALLLLILLGILLAINNITKQKTKENVLIQSPTIAQTQQSSEINPSYKKNIFIPTYSPEKGRGVDLGAPLVTDSLKEIQKIYPFLPFEETIKTPSNQEVILVIPDAISQPNKWTLQINVFGLDYLLKKGDPDYASSKSSFTYATSFLYKWIQGKGADPAKMMIIWGDKEYIQNKSQEWLE